MTFYTVVDEGYEVSVYQTLKSVSEAMCTHNLRFEESEVNATAKEIAAALRKGFKDLTCAYSNLNHLIGNIALKNIKHLLNNQK
jgi:hypothetical protein